MLSSTNPGLCPAKLSRVIATVQDCKRELLVSTRNSYLQDVQALSFVGMVKNATYDALLRRISPSKTNPRLSVVVALGIHPNASFSKPDLPLLHHRSLHYPRMSRQTSYHSTHLAVQYCYLQNLPRLLI
jgi:hypothetical protein